MNKDLARHEAALDWFVRSGDPEFDAWDDFTVWLEQDPSNADAYHAIAQSESELLPFVEIATVEPAPTPKPHRRRIAVASLAAAMAASLAVVITPRLTPIEYNTGPGEVRVVPLGGTDQLVMNGETSVKLAGFSRRNVHLERGQVLMRLVDAGPSKTALFSGDLKLVDIGTVFEVSRDGLSTRVLVSEGAVLADPEGARLQLDPGERLDTTDGAAILQAASGDIASVGAFQRGQLVYVDEPLEHVVADLRRSTGLDISISDAMRARRFTGILSIAEVRRDPRSLGPLLGVSLQPSGKGWKLQGRA